MSFCIPVGICSLLFVLDDTSLYMIMHVAYHCISLYIPIVQDIPIIFACIFSWVNPHGPWFFPQVLLISGYRHLCFG